MERDDYEVFKDMLDQQAEEDKRPYEWGQSITTISNISIRNRQIVEANLGETTIHNCCFEGCTFIGVSFDGTLVRWSTFANCRFYACSFVAVREWKVVESDSSYRSCNGELQKPSDRGRNEPKEEEPTPEDEPKEEPLPVFAITRRKEVEYGVVTLVASDEEKAKWLFVNYEAVRMFVLGVPDPYKITRLENIVSLSGPPRVIHDDFDPEYLEGVT